MNKNGIALHVYFSVMQLAELQPGIQGAGAYGIVLGTVECVLIKREAASLHARSLCRVLVAFRAERTCLQCASEWHTESELPLVELHMNLILILIGKARLRETLERDARIGWTLSRSAPAARI